MMDAANTSEMSVNFYHTTWRNNPEDSHLQMLLHQIKHETVKDEEWCEHSSSILTMHTLYFQRGFK
jgi:hypothetical protein